MAHAKGTPPNSNSDFGVWMEVVSRLAELQIASIAYNEALLTVGSRDIRSQSLLGSLHEFLCVMRDLMTQQRRTPPPILGPDEVLALAHPLKQALSILSEGFVPDALNHLDLNPANILVSDDPCVFLDWAEAAVGPPFLTFEYLMEHFRRSCPTSVHRSAELSQHYANHWKPYAADSILWRYLTVSPLVAVFANAVGNDTWRNPARLAKPQTAGYFRALTRRMAREAHILAQGSPLCPSQ